MKCFVQHSDLDAVSHALVLAEAAGFYGVEDGVDGGVEGDDAGDC